MLSKFKVKSVGGGSFLTYFHHNRAQSCTLAQTQPSLIEVYEAEIRRLREENHNLRIRHNSMATQLNEVVAQLQQANLKLCCCDQFIFKSRKNDVGGLYLTREKKINELKRWTDKWVVFTEQMTEIKRRLYSP